jgi:membrane-associated phospholipid phosphatase
MMQNGQPLGSGSRWAGLVRRNSLILVWLVGMALYAVDFVVKRIPLWREPFNVWVPIDDAFPLIPGWAWVYVVAWLALMFGLVGWYVWENRNEWAHVRAFLIAVLVMQFSGWAILYAVPTYFPRPELAPELIESSLIWRIYSTDPPTYKLPSLHMASILLAAWFFCRRPAVWRYVVGAGAVVLIGFSVMYTKQHGVIDLVTGLLLGWATCYVGWYGSRWVDRRKSQSASPAHGAPPRRAPTEAILDCAEA